MAASRALIIDDEPDIRELLEITLNRMHIDCDCAADLGAARRLLREKSFDLCLTDMKLPDGDGVEFVAYIQRHYPQVPVAVITAHGNMETAIQALKSGAFDFLTKPVDLNLLRTIITSALRLSAEKPEPRRRLVGDSQPIIRLRNTISKIARSQAPVYISGESGSGKELVATMIHEQGPRAGMPFVPVNCGAIPEELMESEFFGHKKGSFTGAVADKDGLFQAATGGTLFLDEIAELPRHMQVKLLRAIQEKTVRPVGAQQETPIDVRILSATHKDLTTLVEQGVFRQDLYYRVNVIELRVPPLRERREDIDQLIGYLLQQLAAGQGIPVPELTGAARRAVQAYSFPGNVRELENILERAMTLCSGSLIEVEDLQLPGEARPKSAETPDASLDNLLDDMEKQKILDALNQTRWNKTAAARLLGISFRALRYRLEKLGLN